MTAEQHAQRAGELLEPFERQYGVETVGEYEGRIDRHTAQAAAHALTAVALALAGLAERGPS